MMIRMVGGWVFLLVPADPGSPGQRAVKRSLCVLCCHVHTYSDSIYHQTLRTLWTVLCKCIRSRCMCNPNGILIGSADFAQFTAECPYTSQWDPSKLPLSMGDLNPRPNARRSIHSGNANWHHVIAHLEFYKSRLVSVSLPRRSCRRSRDHFSVDCLTVSPRCCYRDSCPVLASVAVRTAVKVSQDARERRPLALKFTL